MVESRPGESPIGPPAEPRKAVVERREGARFPAKGVGFRSTAIQASLVDISRDGLAIESLEHPPIGSSLAFALEQGRTRGQADARVCWCTLKRTYRTAGGDVVAVYRAGLRVGRKRSRLFDSIARIARRNAGADSA